MAEEFERADALVIRHSGAASVLGPQRDADACLGGYPAGHRTGGLEWRRLNGMSGLRIRHASTGNGTGAGSLAAVDGDTVRWTAPGDTAGTAVAIAEGETKVLESGTPSAYLVVERVSADALLGTETVELYDVFGNVFGFDDVESAEQAAGDTEYRAVFLENAGSLEITNLTVWLGDCDATVQIAAEAVDGDGKIQTVADEDTAPTGLSWNAGTDKGSGLVIGSLAAGARVGLWIEREIAMGAAAGPQFQVELECEFDVSAVTYSKPLRGLFAIEDETLEGYRLYRGEDAEPDFGAAPWEEFASLPHETAALTVGVDTHLVLRYRNRWGLESQNETATVVRLDGDGAALDPYPQAPEAVSAESAADGAVRVSAFYVPTHDDQFGVRADEFAVWLNDDGTDPDPDVDPETTTVAMSGEDGINPLDTELAGPYLDAAAVRVVVRTRIGASGTDSRNTEVVSLAHNTVPPKPVRRHLFVGPTQAANAGLIAAPTSADDFVVDAVNNIFLRPGEGSVLFYADTVLVWGLIYSAEGWDRNGLYLPADWDLWNGDVSGAGSSEPIEVASWNGTKELYGCVDGVRRMKIDVTNKVLTVPTHYFTAIPNLTAAPVAVWPRKTELGFQVWEPQEERWVTGMTLSAAGLLTSRVVLRQDLDQAAIEALV